MTATENLRAALLSAFASEKSEEGKPEPTPEQMADQATAILAAFAEVVRGPVPTVQGIEVTADDTPAQILAELKDMNTQLTELIKLINISGALTRCTT